MNISKKCFALGIDQGSSSTKGVLLDSDGKIVQSFHVPIRYSSNGPVEYEQDAQEIIESVRSILAEAKSFAQAKQGAVTGLGLACQRSGVVAWDSRSGKALCPLIHWRDERTQPLIDQLGDRSQLVWRKAGIPPSANYAAGKFALLQKEYQHSDHRIGTLDSYINWCLYYDNVVNDCFTTEDSMAQRTMLYDLQNGSWSSELCDMFGVEKDRLPSIVPSFYAQASDDQRDSSALLPAVRLGDQQAALLGVMAKAGDSTVLNLGTLASLACAMEAVPAIPGYIGSVLYSHNLEQKSCAYMLEGTVNCCGQTVREIENRTGVQAAELSSVISGELLKGELPLAFCPFGGTTTPDWLPPLQNVIPGWRKLSPVQLAAVLLENLGNFIIRNIKQFHGASIIEPNVDVITVVGGISAIDPLLQQISDATGFTLQRMPGHELGAWLVARGVQSESVTDLLSSYGDVSECIDERFSPISAEAKGVAEARYLQWVKLGEKAKSGVLNSEDVLPELC